MEIYTGIIHKLKSNEYFVFGSNTQGRHGKGAALTARKEFGAIYGQSTGFQGNSYAIVTKDLRKTYHPSIEKSEIINQIDVLYYLANNRPHDKFYIAYSGTAVNLNGYTPQEMADMFSQYFDIPENVIFEEEFSKLL